MLPDSSRDIVKPASAKREGGEVGRSPAAGTQLGDIDPERLVPHLFSDLVARDIREDEEYRRVHLAGTIETFLEGDSVTAQLMLRDFVKGTIGFAELGRRLGKSPKSLMRMLSAKGNPRADNLSAILKALQEQEGVTLTVTAG